MPSHIYSMLGMWGDSVRSNLAAEAAANEYATRNFPDATDPAIPHLLDFRIYAYLQLGKDGDAAQVVGLLPRLKKLRLSGLQSTQHLLLFRRALHLSGANGMKRRG